MDESAPNATKRSSAARGNATGGFDQMSGVQGNTPGEQSAGDVGDATVSERTPFPVSPTTFRVFLGKLEEVHGRLLGRRQAQTKDEEPETADEEPETADEEPETLDEEPETAGEDPVEQMLHDAGRQIEELKADVEQMKDQFGRQCQKRLHRAESDVKELKHDIKDLEHEVRSLKKKVTDLRHEPQHTQQRRGPSGRRSEAAPRFAATGANRRKLGRERSRSPKTDPEHVHPSRAHRFRG